MSASDIDSIDYTTLVIKDLCREPSASLTAFIADIQNNQFPGLRTETLNFHIRYCLKNKWPQELCEQMLRRAVLAYDRGLRSILIEDYLDACRKYLGHRRAADRWALAAESLIFFPTSLQKTELERLIAEVRTVFDLFCNFNAETSDCAEEDLIYFLESSNNLSVPQKQRDEQLSILMYKILTPEKESV